MADVSRRDWYEWHRPYDVPGSALAARLELVQAHIIRALEAAPPGPVRVVSICAGQGRDLIGAVAAHGRAPDVHARLVELDPRNAEVARELAGHAGLDVEVVTGDASMSAAYSGAVPAGIVLACGIFGNISHADIRKTVGLLPMLCDEGATVIWTRHRRPPDLTPAVRRWFADVGFESIAWDGPRSHRYVGVGVERWPQGPGILREGVRFFQFVGDPSPECH